MDVLVAPQVFCSCMLLLALTVNTEHISYQYSFSLPVGCSIVWAGTIVCLEAWEEGEGLNISAGGGVQGCVVRQGLSLSVVTWLL